jgi:hypothetical protein
MENPWYGLWTLELLKLTESFNNIAIVPQYALWFTLPEDEPDVEPVEEIDEGAVSEVADEGSDQNKDEPDGSDDELNLFRDADESVNAIKHDEPEIPNIDQDPDTSFAESLFTVPDGSAPQVIPDFVALHILAEELNFPANARLRRKYERRTGYGIIHECCPLVVEIKAFPTRDLGPAKFNKFLSVRLALAIQDLGFQCYHLFKMYEHALRTVVVAASGDHWTHRIVTRSDVPRAAVDGIDTQPWDKLKFPPHVVLGSRTSDLRMRQIYDFLHAKPAQPED